MRNLKTVRREKRGPNHKVFPAKKHEKTLRSSLGENSSCPKGKVSFPKRGGVISERFTARESYR